MEAQKATGFLKNAYYQGHGRYVNQLARVTLKFCKFSGGSREMRKFIETKLVDTARENPGCVIYVKPRMFKTPVLSAEYLNGNYHYFSLHRMGCYEIEHWLKWFLTRSGEDMYKIHIKTASYRPTVQGIWSPFYFRDPKLNVTEFPDEELGKHLRSRPSATEQIRRMANESRETQSN